MTTWQASNRMRVGEHYGINEDRWIGQTGGRERAKFYDPWEFPELLAEFTKIQMNDDPGVLEFVRERGMIWDQLDQDQPQMNAVDPVEFIEKHAAIVRFALNLIDLIHWQDEIGVDEYLSSELGALESQVHPALLREQLAEIQRASEVTGLFAGSQVLSALIGVHLRSGVGRDVLPTKSGYPKRVTKANNLLQVIYCFLEDAWEGKQGYYQCENRTCNEWRLIDRSHIGPKPKYCPPADGAGPSVCGRQERYYRSKESSSSKEKNDDQA